MNTANQQFIDYTKRGDLAIMKILIDDINQEIKDKALIIAAGLGYEDCVVYLLAQGAEVNARDDNKNTVLFMTKIQEKRSIVKLLIESGADINAQNSNKKTVLHRASGLGQLDDVKYFIEQGADIFLLDASGRTALQWARFNDHDEVAKCLANYPQQLAEQKQLEFLIGKHEHASTELKF